MPAEIIEAAPKYQGWSTLLVARIRLPDGRVVVREIEHHGRAACVLAFDPDRRTALLVRQVRAPPVYAAQQAHLLEAIAGLIEEGEAPEACARREAMEEAGLRLSAIEHVTTAWTMPGISTERMDLFLGAYSQADRVGSGGGTGDEGIEVVEIPLAELAAMTDAGTLADMKTLLLLQTLRLRRPDLFAPTPV
jgi:nudix-type nucleoside diphosphatase (YffH/AdpP family)